MSKKNTIITIAIILFALLLYYVFLFFKGREPKYDDGNVVVQESTAEEEAVESHAVFGESEEDAIPYPQTFVYDPNNILAEDGLISEVNRFMMAQAIGTYLEEHGYTDVRSVELVEDSVEIDGSATSFKTLLPDGKTLKVTSYNLTESFKFELSE